MEEADVADRIAMLDGGLLQITGTPEQIKAKFNFTNLEDVFVSLTGKGLRQD